MPRLFNTISRYQKLKLLKKHVPRGYSILEVGPGSGWYSEKLRMVGHEVTTIDVVPPADIVGDINAWRHLGITVDSYDAIVAFEIIEHVDCLAVLTEICKPGGLIALSSPHPDWDWLMIILEFLRFNQQRSSPHTNLTYFNKIQLPVVLLKRPGGIHQVAIFRNGGV